jgi:hypothetical protein
MGRKPKPPGEKKVNTLRVMLTEQERAVMDDAAKKANLETSTFVRAKILEMIRKSKSSK